MSEELWGVWAWNTGRSEWGFWRHVDGGTGLVEAREALDKCVAIARKAILR
jgi:hypothetical protein